MVKWHIDRSVFFYWLPPLLWVAMVLAFSGELGSSQYTFSLFRWMLSWIPSLTLRDIRIIHYYFRSFVHFAAYAVLYFLWYRAVRGHLGWSWRQALPAVAALCVVTALLDEGHQSFLQTRTGSLSDVALDLSGAIIAAIITPMVWKPGHFLKLPDPAKSCSDVV